MRTTADEWIEVIGTEIGVATRMGLTIHWGPGYVVRPTATELRDSGVYAAIADGIRITWEHAERSLQRGSEILFLAAVDIYELTEPSGRCLRLEDSAATVWKTPSEARRRNVELAQSYLNRILPGQ